MGGSPPVWQWSDMTPECRHGGCSVPGTQPGMEVPTLSSPARKQPLGFVVGLESGKVPIEPFTLQGAHAVVSAC